jgi:hypothetical protein
MQSKKPENISANIGKKSIPVNDIAPIGEGFEQGLKGKSPEVG